MALEKDSKDKKSGGPSSGGGGKSTASNDQAGSYAASKLSSYGAAKALAKGTAGNSAVPTVIPNGQPIPPGATQNFPDANAAAVVDTLLGAVPGYGLADTMYKGAKLATGQGDLTRPMPGMFGDAFGAEYGEPDGYRADRYRGQDSLTGIGGSGGAVNSADDERVLAGRSIGAGTQALTGDSGSDVGAGTNELYSDVTLKDRRKPKLDNLGAGSRMALALA